MKTTFPNKYAANLPHALPARLVLAAAMAMAAPCFAGSIELTPIQIDLSTQAKVAILTVRNTGTEESLIQVTLNQWAAANPGSPVLQSRDLVITPATFRLAAGGEQLVRVGLTNTTATPSELSYRLVVEEVPPPPAANATQARFIVRHDLPVFVAPSGAPRSSLDISMDCAVGGAGVRVTNLGNVHTKLRTVTLAASSTTPGTQIMGGTEKFAYLLPAGQRTWRLADVAPGLSGKDFKVTTLTDQGTFTADVKNKCS